MARYIDADALILEISSLSITLGGKELLGEITKNSVIRMVNEQPTADVVPRSEWISVDERLPKEGVRVLVWLKGDGIKYTSIDTDRLSLKKWVRWGKLVTHWMPLPEPPKMKG